MYKNTQLGLYGEKLATDFLKSKGYRVIATNYRYKHAEVDIIAIAEDLLVFIEVKTRSGDKYGEP